jgi:hypothetical protein
MIDLYVKGSKRPFGTITEAELQFLADSMEETSLDDQDYFIDQATIDLLADGRATDHLVDLLRKAVGTGEGIDIRWERK